MSFYSDHPLFAPLHSVAAIASKMALVMPVLFSLFFLGIESNFQWYNFLGIGLAMVATYHRGQFLRNSHRHHYR